MSFQWRLRLATAFFVVLLPYSVVVAVRGTADRATIAFGLAPETALGLTVIAGCLGIVAALLFVHRRPLKEFLRHR